MLRGRGEKPLSKRVAWGSQLRIVGVGRLCVDAVCYHPHRQTNSLSIVPHLGVCGTPASSMKKAAAYDIVERMRQVCADPCNDRIPRVARAGQFINGHLIAHNGLKLAPMNQSYMAVLEANRGCHAPQEEWIFQEVLRHVPAGGTIIELGSYWSFFAMWFFKTVEGATCYLVDAGEKNLEVGRRNFEANGCTGTFVRERVGHGFWGVDRFVREKDIAFVDILHADIAGAEYEMLSDATETLEAGRIGYVFVGTHGQDLHYRCKRFLEDRGYVTIAHADFDHGTYCFDGVLVAGLPSLAGTRPLDLPLRAPHERYSIGDKTDDLSYIREPTGLKKLRWRYHALKSRVARRWRAAQWDRTTS